MHPGFGEKLHNATHAALTESAHVSRAYLFVGLIQAFQGLTLFTVIKETYILA